jgi:AIPR protein
VPLPKFYEFITENGVLRGHIFEANVRAFEGDVTVNNEIGGTLAVVGNEEFWWLNNGITILCTEAIGAGDLITITHPLIVNGLQTSFVLYNHFRGVEMSDPRNILVRVIKPDDPQSVDKIIKATNSQTRIPAIWLHATEDIHKSIEQILKSFDLYYDRRKNHYRNKGIPAAKIVTLPYLSQAVASIILQKPDDARARPTTVADRNYKNMFSDRYPIEHYAKCALLLKKVRRCGGR